MVDGVSAVILSGGKNSRMNYEVKAFLNIETERFIDRIIKAVDGFDEIAISCNDLKLYEEFSHRCTLVLDEVKDIGPMGGIYSSLKKIKTNKAIVVAADMPFIDKEIIEAMVKIDFEGDALIPIVQGKEEPLCGVYKKSCIGKIEELIENKNYRIKNLIKDLKVTYIIINDKTMMTNVNTPQEYKASIGRREKRPKVINIVASCSNVGKTTVIEGLIKELISRGFSVATIKHDVHGFEIDKEGKDTWRHRMAGANTVSISSKNRFAMIKEVKEEMPLNEIIEMNQHSDFIIVEGYKNSDLRKIEVIRKEITKKVITPKEKLMAIISDFNIHMEGIPCVHIEDYKKLSDIVEMDGYS